MFLAIIKKPEKTFLGHSFCRAALTGGQDQGRAQDFREAGAQSRKRAAKTTHLFVSFKQYGN